MDYTMEGEYPIDTIPAAIGCDSIRILRLMVEDLNEITIDTGICEGEVFTILGWIIPRRILCMWTLYPGPNGCDTIINLDLQVSPLPTADAGPDKTLDCAMQTVTLDGSATGGSPLWTGPGINATNEDLLMPEVAQSGLYILTVTSGANCSDTDSWL